MQIIHRHQLLSVLVMQQHEHRQFDENEKSFMATQMAGILSQSQLNGLFIQYRQIQIRALAAAPMVAIAQG